jgi:hypothetical protein
VLSLFEENCAKGYNISYRICCAVFAIKMAEIGRKNTLVLVTKFKEVSVLTQEVSIGLFLENLREAGHFSPYYA